MFVLGRYYESVDSIEQDLDRAIGYYRQVIPFYIIILPHIDSDPCDPFRL